MTQCSKVGTSGVFRLKLCPLSLSGTAFTWFTSLAPNSISTWAQLEQKFHEYFYSGETELRLSDLTMVRQKYNEHVHDYIRRFRDIKNRCFSLTIAEKDLADIAFSGLLAHIKGRRLWRRKTGLRKLNNTVGLKKIEIKRRITMWLTP